MFFFLLKVTKATEKELFIPTTLLFATTKGEIKRDISKAA